MILSYFFPYTSEWGKVAGQFFNILAAFAFVLGGGNLLKVHLKKVSDQGAGWGFSGVVLACFLVTLFIGLFKIGSHPNPDYPNVIFSGETQGTGSAFWWAYEYVFKPLTATMFSMLAFYVASAAFRAFRAKNFEAILLLGTAFIILLGRTAAIVITDWIPNDGPFGDLRLENLSVYVMQVFNTAGMRAIIIGIALGIASTSLKILLGIDRSFLGSGD
jgi:hypothetical protein